MIDFGITTGSSMAASVLASGTQVSPLPLTTRIVPWSVAASQTLPLMSFVVKSDHRIALDSDGLNVHLVSAINGIIYVNPSSSAAFTRRENSLPRGANVFRVAGALSTILYLATVLALYSPKPHFFGSCIAHSTTAAMKSIIMPAVFGPSATCSCSAIGIGASSFIQEIIASIPAGSVNECCSL